MDEAVARLGSVPLFEGLSDKELQSIAQTGKPVDFPAGKEIVKEGASGVGFHLIVNGNASVLVGGEVVAQLGPGSYFGEMSLIDGGPRSATVRADTDVRTLSLTSWDFMPLLDANPSIARKLLVEMTRRLRAAEQSHTH